MVPLDIHAALHEHLKATAADPVNGQPLWLSGVLLPPPNINNVDPILKDFVSRKHVFVSQKVSTGTLQMPYDGSFTIISRSEKIFSGGSQTSPSTI